MNQSGNHVLAWRGEAQQRLDLPYNLVRVAKGNTPNVILPCLLFGLAIAFPCAVEAFPAPAGQGVVQLVGLDGAQSGAKGRCAIPFLDQRCPDWLGDLVEVVAPVSPECEAMRDQCAKEECKKREEDRIFHMGVWALLTFIAGLLVGARI